MHVYGIYTFKLFVLPFFIGFVLHLYVYDCSYEFVIAWLLAKAENSLKIFFGGGIAKSLKTRIVP